MYGESFRFYCMMTFDGGAAQVVHVCSGLWTQAYCGQNPCKAYTTLLNPTKPYNTLQKGPLPESPSYVSNPKIPKPWNPKPYKPKSYTLIPKPYRP